VGRTERGGERGPTIRNRGKLHRQKRKRPAATRVSPLGGDRPNGLAGRLFHQGREIIKGGIPQEIEDSKSTAASVLDGDILPEEDEAQGFVPQLEGRKRVTGGGAQEITKKVSGSQKKIP